VLPRTSLLIDLYVGEVLSAAFGLSLVLSAPDVIIRELLEPDGRALVACGLSPIELSGVEVGRGFNLRGRFLRISVNDLFAVVAAKTRAATLLTNDRQQQSVNGPPTHVGHHCLAHTMPPPSTK
jgi:hypothetical protein